MMHTNCHKKTILPFIRQHGLKAITPELLLSWMNQAHKLLAASLCKASGVEPGVYCDVETVQWQWGVATHHEVERYLGGENCDGKKILELAKKSGVPNDKAKNILRVLTKIRNMKSLDFAVRKIIPNYQFASTNEIGQSKLYAAVKQDFFTG